MGALMRIPLIASAICLCVVALCQADDATASIRKTTNIPAEELGSALQTLAKDYDFQVLYRTETVNNLKTQGAVGSLTSDEALVQVLSGTGLSYKYLDPQTVTIISASTAVSQSNSEQGTQDTGGGKQSSQDFRVAQVDQATSKASAVEVENTEAAHEKKSDLDEIVVTGTHIRGAAPSSPVQIITREDIERSGYTSIGDVMRSLPQNYNGGNNPQLVAGSAPGIDNGASFTGGSTPNLRGLGSGSTLTLVNGHRLAADTINGAVDISLIPLAAIERVEVVTDGASAAYGSDAVAGVVNIILKKDYNGSLTSVLGGGTTQGGGTEKQVNQLLGKTWTGGGVLVDFEYDRTDPINSTQRSYTLEAGVPTTLNPESSRNSLFLTANQDLGSRVSAFVDALYTYRISADSISYAGEGFTLNSELDVHQYSTTFGLDVLLPGDWELRPSVDLAEQRSVDSNSAVPGGPYPTLIFEGRASSYEVVADGPIVTLPAGVVRGAVGGGYRRESFAYLQPGAGAVVDAERGVGFAYAELQIPLLSPGMGTWIRKLDLMVSGREEHYSEFGGKSVPQLGLVYTPADSLKTRATWGKSFRAPTLYDQFNIGAVDVLKIPNSGGTTSPILLETGGDPNLRPETARTWTVGADYDSERVKGLHLSATYYDISYIDRISRIPTFFSALTDPLFAPFVTLSPSAAQQQSVISAAGPNFFDTTGAYNPGNIAALVNDELVNVSRQDIKGVDLSANYKVPTYKGSLEIFANASYLDLRQQFVPGAPEVEISGQAFEPAKFRARGGATFGFGPLSATGIVNYTGGEVNPYVPDNTHIASWTTFDLQLGFRPQLSGGLSGFQAALSVQNLFDRDPPLVLFDQFVPGLHYDPTNASVLGRFISLRLSKEFK
jgi:iron complex outermembrane recepter protein